MQSGVDIGVKYSEKQQRNFDEAKMKAGQCVIGLQVGCPAHAPEGRGAGGGGQFYLTLSTVTAPSMAGGTRGSRCLKCPRDLGPSRLRVQHSMPRSLERLRLGWVGERWLCPPGCRGTGGGEEKGHAWGSTRSSPDPLVRWARTSVPASPA